MSPTQPGLTPAPNPHGRGRTKGKTWTLVGLGAAALFTLIIGHGCGYSSVLRGALAFLLGIASVATVIAVSRKISWVAHWRGAMVISPALLAAGSVWGMIGSRGDAAEKAGICQQYEHEARGLLAEKNFSVASRVLNDAQLKCPDTEAATLTQLQQDIAQQNQAFQVANAAAKEAKAVEDFPQKSAEIVDAYKRAAGEVARYQWSNADNDLQGAEAALASFEGTSVTQSKQYQDIAAKLGALRAKLDPQLQQLQEKQEAKERAQAAADEKAEKPESCVKLAKMFGAGSSLTDLQKDEAWEKYKDQYFQLDLRITDVRAGILSGVHVSAECANWPDLWPIQVDYEDAQWAQQLTKGKVWRLRGKLRTLTLGALIADGCSRDTCE